MTFPAEVTFGSTEAVTLTARFRSTRRIDANPRPGSTAATWLNGTSPPSVVRMRMFSRSPSDRRSSRG